MGTNKYMKLTQEDLLNKLREYYEENGRSPSQSVVKNPTCIVYYDRFGTQKWNDILRLAGLETLHNNNYTEDELLNYLRKVAEIANNENKKIGKDYMNNKKFIPCYDMYVRKFGSMDKALSLIGEKEYYTEEEKINNSIELLKDMAKKLGRCPTVQEFELKCSNYKYVGRRLLEKKEKTSYNWICKKYIPQYELNNRYDDFTKEEIEEDIKSVLTSINYIPSYREYAKLSNKGYGFTTIQKYCGCTYIELVASIGFDITSANKVGSCLLDKRGQYCRSLAEMHISNYFYDNEIPYEKERIYKDIPNFRPDDNRRADWEIKINNKIYYVEYFGCWQEYNKKEIVANYRRKTKKKINDFLKYGHKDNCIFIFPWEYSHKTLDEIFDKYLKAG